MGSGTMNKQTSNENKLSKSKLPCHCCGANYGFVEDGSDIYVCNDCWDEIGKKEKTWLD